MKSVRRDEHMAESDGFHLLGKDGRSTVPVDAEFSAFTYCPVCAQQWPGQPAAFVCLDEGFAVLDGKVLHLRQLELRLLAALIDNAGRFALPAVLVEQAYYDRPDADQPKHRIVSVVFTKLRAELKRTRYVIDSRPRYGYRLTTKDIADGLRTREREQRERETVAWREMQDAERATKALTKVRGEAARTLGRLKAKKRVIH